MFEIVKIYLFDIFIMNSDHNLGNFGFLYKNNEIQDIYILDNEFAFDDNEPVIISSKFDSGDELNKKVKLNTRDYNRDNLEELEYFLATSSSEFIDLFISMYNILTPEVVKNTYLNILESNNEDISKIDNIMYKYRINYKVMGELINKRNIRK